MLVADFCALTPAVRALNHCLEGEELQHQVEGRGEETSSCQPGHSCEHKTGSQVMAGRYRDGGAITIYTQSVGGDLASVIRVSLTTTPTMTVGYQLVLTLVQ